MAKIDIKEKTLDVVSIPNVDTSIVFIPEKGEQNAKLVHYKKEDEYKGQNNFIKKTLASGLEVITATFTDTSTFTTWLGEGCPLKDRAICDIRFITSGNIYKDDESGDSGSTKLKALNNALIAVAETRKDCVALLHGKSTSITVEAIKGDFDGINSTYASCFAPFITFKGDETPYPPTLGYLVAYGNSTKENPTWFATAGAKRGAIKGIDKVKVELGDVDTETLQPVDGTLAINPIYKDRNFGIIIWGNRTGLDDSSNQKLSKNHFLNIRNLLCTLRKVTYFACKRLTFEQNDDILWINFKALIEPTLNKMKSGRGIRGYRIERVATDKLATLCAKISIVPIEAVEDFEITIELANSIDNVNEE